MGTELIFRWGQAIGNGSKAGNVGYVRWGWVRKKGMKGFSRKMLAVAY